MKIRTLLAATLFALAFLLAIIGVAGIYGIHSTNDALASASENVPTVIAVLSQQEDIARARLRLDRVTAGQDEASPATLASAAALISESDRAWASYTAFTAGDDEKRLAADVAHARDDLLSKGIQPLMSALKSSDTESSNALAYVTLPKLYATFSDATAKLSQFQAEDSARLVQEGIDREQKTMLLTISVTLVGMFSAVVSWLILRNAISMPLAAATEHFGAIEAGDLTSRIVIARDDELGGLLRSLARMQDSLRETVMTIRTGVDHVADAADEIASGNGDLSKRTEQHAASLEETAASMEELTATVKQTAENTREASNLARVVTDAAGGSADVVKRLAGTMSELRRGSSEIAEITAIIEGIAFQTNILALNAAVEAARAGEQGRGFAVVATEVRALAQRSGKAAKEIKDLIGASVTRVEEGATQAVDAAGRMDHMLVAIDRVAVLLGQIASASQEQARGIEQVNTAVSHMDEVTQQNAALVEEAAAASESMTEQASKIRGVVAGFKVHAAT